MRKGRDHLRALKRQFVGPALRASKVVTVQSKQNKGILETGIREGKGAATKCVWSHYLHS